MDIISILEQYGLTNVLIGLAATIICGIVKVPLAKAIKAKQIDAKQASQSITSCCNLIVTCVASVGIIILALLKNALDPLQISEGIATSIVCAKLIYALYEGWYNAGNGWASIKTWVHKLLKAVSDKIKKVVPTKVKDVTSIVQTALIDEVHLPLTDEQLTKLKEVLTKKL